MVMVVAGRRPAQFVGNLLAGHRGPGIVQMLVGNARTDGGARYA